MSSYIQKRKYSFVQNCEKFVANYPLENLGLLTLTFQTDVTAREANRRLNSFNRVLRELFLDRIIIMERGGKNGRWHFHFLVAVTRDIRTGFDFKYKRLSKLPAPLLNILAMLDDVLPKYGFGWIIDLQPVQHPQKIPNYLAKYLSKAFENRRPEDKGAKLVRYAQKQSYSTVKFSWNTDNAKKWRRKLKIFTIAVCGDLEEVNGLNYSAVLRRHFSPNWCWHLAPHILDIDNTLARKEMTLEDTFNPVPEAPY